MQLLGLEAESLRKGTIIVTLGTLASRSFYIFYFKWACLRVPRDARETQFVGTCLIMNICHMLIPYGDEDYLILYYVLNLRGDGAAHLC